MRAERRVSLVLLFVCLAGVPAACSARRPASEASSPPPARAALRATPPSDPDLATVMERFYQQVEGAHWKFAYAMLSPRYRAALSQSAFEDRYLDLVSPDVTLQQKTDRAVIARISARDRLDRSKHVALEETVALGWDGERWEIDDIRRRDLSPDTR